MALKESKDFVKLSNAPSKTQLHRLDVPDAYATRHAERLFDNIIAAFNEVEQTMALELAVKLKQAVVQTWKDNSTKGPIDKAEVTAQMPYQKLTGTNGLKKRLYYPYWFFLAVWLGPGHPLLQSIRNDISSPSKPRMSLFYGKPATAPKENCIEERAKAIKKTIDNSPVNGLSAAIKGHLPDDLNEFGTNPRIYSLEMRLASANHELEDTRTQISNLEKGLAESKASQARALEKTKSDMETFRKEIQQLKTAHGQTDNVKKDLEALREMLTQHSTNCQQRAAGIETKVLSGHKKVEKEMNVLRSEVAHSDEKAEKAVETGALVLSILSTTGGPKRKLDDMS
ncbi:hypothetical protein FOYG_10334 [Fusarium oxysporum NRRL 32931]|uniref:Uncharacterized protein n=1 Tax=Fusarium oxysporum NRRL 32931 TaxID=660029 RepID=W9I8A2_FUSOX|nr:hypothetical protein FOYG_10334 [Fusarium oxysporum NRRL 32931]